MATLISLPDLKWLNFFPRGRLLRPGPPPIGQQRQQQPGGEVEVKIMSQM